VTSWRAAGQKKEQKKRKKNDISVFSNFPNGKLSILIIFEKFFSRETSGASGSRILGPGE